MDMHDWLVVGTHWVLCRASVGLGNLATVVTYDGQEVTGKARRGLYGWIVVKAQS